MPETIGEHADDLFRNPRAPTGGNPDGDVTLAMFFDYNCGCCRGFARELAAVEDADRGLRVVYLELPILGARSALAARAALAAARQDAYVEFHHALMASQGYTQPAVIQNIAMELLLDLDRLQEDMEDIAFEETLERNLALARELGIQGTPAFVIGERLVQGAMPREQLAALISREREASGP
ncbi:MAG: DsbA family protein [Thioalkalivibrio sp.]|nr:DsbA family protein [Thioalkalivibrio sp.]